jgi:hypothetical protein
MLLVSLCVAGCSRPVAKVEPEALPSDDQLRDRIDEMVAFTRDGRHLDMKDQAAWQIVHGALAYGRDFVVYDNGKLISAVDYLLDGGQLRGWVLRKGDHGVQAVVEAGSKTGQGHPDQWLGYLSQSGLSADAPIVVGGETFKVRDLVTQAQWDIFDGMEATWTLMAFTTYMPLDSEWKAKDGSDWTIPRIVAMEAAQDLDDSACGGTHRMYALAVALKRYLADGGKLSPGGDGPWEKAQAKINDCIAAARNNQQPDGSFSTNFFSRPGTSPEMTIRIHATGHTLEFLAIALPDEDIDKPWVTRAVVYLLDCLELTKESPLECGALYHAARGLDLYRLRRFGPRPSAEPSSPAQPAASEAATAAAP